jgi:hypothetical protein
MIKTKACLFHFILYFLLFLNIIKGLFFIFNQNFIKNKFLYNLASNQEQSPTVINFNKNNSVFDEELPSNRFIKFCKKPTKSTLNKIWKTTYVKNYICLNVKNWNNILNIILV